MALETVMSYTMLFPVSFIADYCTYTVPDFETYYEGNKIRHNNVLIYRVIHRAFLYIN